jgi:hypothetical protein
MGQRLVAYARCELLLARRKPAAALEVLDSLALETTSADYITPRLELLRGETLAALNRLEDAAAAFQDARRGADLITSRSLSWRISARALSDWITTALSAGGTEASAPFA